VEEREYILAFQAGTRTYTLLEGEELSRADDVAAAPLRAAIIEALRTAAAPLAPTAIARIANLDADDVRHAVWRMLKDGLLVRSGYGKWALPAPVGEERDAPAPEAEGPDENEKEAPVVCPSCAGTTILWLPDPGCWWCGACGWGHPSPDDA
jgi:hypothetical protein